MSILTIISCIVVGAASALVVDRMFINPKRPASPGLYLKGVLAFVGLVLIGVMLALGIEHVFKAI
jgi:hypothetical protein